MNVKVPKTLTMLFALTTVFLLIGAVLLTDSRAADSAQFEPATERTEAIARYEQMQYGMFIHYGVNTYLEKPFCTIGTKKIPLPPLEIYNPTKLDVDQWVATAKKAGMQYAVLTVKHWLGFALWDSKYSDYDVAASGNKTDVVAEFVKACRKYEIAPCFLYSVGQDMAHRKEKGMTEDEWYELAFNQIRELLTNYGPIATMWFDGMGKDFPAERAQQTYDIVKSLQPNCIVVMHDPSQFGTWPTDVFQPGRDVPQKKHNPKMEHNGKTYYLPMDILGTVVENWFWRPDARLASKAELLNLYRNITGRGANFTLGAAPDREGKLPDDQVERLMELAEAIRSDANNIQDKSVHFEPATERTEVIARYEQLDYGLWINFGMWSINDKTLDELQTSSVPPPEAYNPTNLDVDQWIATAKKAGMSYAVLDVKNWHGFASWDSKFSDYDVAASGNKTDVVAEFVKACRKYGLAPCFNYCLGVDAAHKRDKKMTDDEWYELANNQIREVLTNYGPITTMWFDGMKGGEGEDFPAERVQQAYDTVKSVQPDCLVVMHDPGQQGRWPTDILQPGGKVPAPEGYNPWMEHNGKKYYIPMEVLGWVTKPGQVKGNKKRTRPLPVLLDLYRNAISRGANISMLVWPNKEGRLPANQAKRVLELGEAIRELKK